MRTIEDRLGFTTEDIHPSSVSQSKDLGIEEVVLDSQEVQNAARQNLDFFAALCLPTVIKYLFPKVFKGIWAWLLSYVDRVRDFSQLVIGLPRGFGKTMLIKIFVVFCILFTKKRFILIVCGTQGKANNIIADIVGILNESNIQKVFGDWKLGASTDRQDLKKFGFRGRNIILLGAGAGSDIRGITLDNERPDIMIFDDIQTKEAAESEVISEALETWLYGTAMKAKSPHGCLFIFIANMYPTKWSLLRRMKTNPTWIKFIAGGITADGKSLWEDLQPIQQLLVEFERDLLAGKPDVFYSEVLNDENISKNFLIDLTKIPIFDITDEFCLGKFVVIDPSSDKKKSDAVAVGYFEIYGEKQTPVLMEVVEERLSPGETIEVALAFCLVHNCRLVVIESNAYQYSLLYWFNFICLQKGIEGIQCADIYSGMLSKPSRIMSMFKELMSAEVALATRVQSQVFSQIAEYNPLKRDNVDGILDLLTYAKRVVTQYIEFIMSSLTIEMQNYNAIPIREAHETAGF